ncbi:MAG: hypothetical protein ACRD21_26950, partial [Vicinamibacteria bacterium]
VTLIEDREGGLRFPSGPADPTPLGGITLAADRISVQRAVLVIVNEKVPWTLEGQNLSLNLERLRNDRYHGKFAYEEGRLRIKDHEGFQASVTADFEIVPHEIFLREGLASSDFGSVQATGKLGLAGGVRARFEVEGEGDVGRAAESLLGVTGVSKVLEGRTSFRGTLSIEPEGKTLEGTLLLPEGRIAGVPFADWRGELFWDRSILQLGYAQGTLAGGGAKLQLQQPLPIAEHRASLDLDVQGASLSRILSGASGAASPLDSLISGRGSFRFPTERPLEIEGAFDLSGMAPVLEGSSSVATPISFEVRGDVEGEELHIDELQFRTSFLEGTLSGTYPRKSSALFSIDVGSSDLAATDLLQQKVRKLAGVDPGAIPSAWGVSGRGGAQGQLTERLPDLSFRGELTAEDLRIDGI